MDNSKQAIYAMIAFIFLGFMGWYYAQAPKHSMKAPSAEPLADAIVRGLNFVQYDQHGKRARVLFTPEMRIYNQDNRSVFEDPHISLYRDQSPPWSIKSQHGKSLDGSKTITLWRDVIMHQAASSQNPERTILTEEINYVPEKNYASTQQEITLQQDGLLVKSRGLHAYLDKQYVELLSKVRGRYEPQKKSTN